MTNRLKVGKDYRPELRRRMAGGWTLQTGRGKHPKLTCPAGAHAVPLPTSSTAPPMLRGWLAELRRHDRTCGTSVPAGKPARR